MSERMDAQWSLTMVLLCAILGLVGFVIWDRKTALRPLEKRLTRIEDHLEDDLEMDSPAGSRLNRLMEALRELAREDQRLANALRRYALLEDLPSKAAV